MKIEIGETIVRRAEPADAAEIANAHLNSWREAYLGILPQDYLDSLPLTFKRRMKSWSEMITAKDKAVFVAESETGIVGFAGMCHPRDESMSDYGELGAIYLLNKFKGKGVGAALLQMGMRDLLKWNFTKAYCWVLEKNPTIEFYKRSGASAHGDNKEDVIGGMTVNEVRYVWKDLEQFR